jgi:uncharacterized protein (DUF433 family)
MKINDINPISINSEIMGGTPCFTGTRVPVKTLIEYLQGGETVNDFLEGFPSVTPASVTLFLDRAAEPKYNAVGWLLEPTLCAQARPTAWV